MCTFCCASRGGGWGGGGLLRSCFAWLATVMVVSLPLRAFSGEAYAGVYFLVTAALAGAAALELLRFLLYKMAQRGVHALEKLATGSARGGTPLRPPGPLDVAHISIAIGCGLALAHIAFFQWSTVELGMTLEGDVGPRGGGFARLESCPWVTMTFAAGTSITVTLKDAYTICDITMSVYLCDCVS